MEQGTAAHQSQDGRVVRVPVGGCAVAQPDCPHLIATLFSPAGVTLSFDGASLYWSEYALDVGQLAGTGRVWRQDLPAGAPAAVAEMQDQPRRFAVDDRSVYWVDAGSGEVRRQDYQLGTPGGAVLVGGQLAPVDVVYSAFQQRIYWTNYGDSDFTGSVWGADPDGAGAAALATNQQQPRGIAAGSATVYWANAGNGTIMRLRTDGSAADAFTSSLLTPNDVALDADWLYSAEGGTPPNYRDGRVVARRLDGSEARTLAAGRIHPRALALDADTVYWVDRGTPNADNYDGAVAKVAKPR